MSYLDGLLPQLIVSGRKPRVRDNFSDPVTGRRITFLPWRELNDGLSLERHRVLFPEGVYE
jgi:hypothetical protein